MASIFSKISLVAALLTFNHVLNAQNQRPDSYRWTTLETTGDITGRYENAFVEFQNKFYLIGDFGINVILFNNNIYFAAGNENRGVGNMNSIEVFSADHNWQPLFNGKNLDGWEIKCIEEDRDYDFWKVEDGAIVCNSMNSENHNYVWLQSKNEYADFELRLKFK